MPTPVTMKDLVDALYYDYILYKLAGLYTSDNKNETIVQYQKIAQKLLVKLRSDRMVFDPEVGLKFTYIKLYDLHLSFPKCAERLHASCCQEHYSEFLATCYDYLSKIMVEYSALKKCDTFKQLFKLTALLFAFSFPTLDDLKNLEGMEKSLHSLGSYLNQQNIEIRTEDEFSQEKSKFLELLNITVSSENEIFNKTFECMMEELKKVFLSFNVPVFQFFVTREAMQLKEAYPEVFEGFEGVPASTKAYKEEIVNDYLDLRSSLNKARGIFINPKDKGEKVDWSPDI